MIVSAVRSSVEGRLTISASLLIAMMCFFVNLSVISLADCRTVGTAHLWL